MIRKRKMTYLGTLWINAENYGEKKQTRIIKIPQCVPAIFVFLKHKDTRQAWM